MSPEEETEFKARRKARNGIFAAIIFGFVVLVYAITVVKVTD